MKEVSTRDLLQAANACERAATAADVQEERRAVMDVIAHEHAISVGLMQAKLAKLAALNMTGRQEERLPLRQDGEDWGYIESRIPADVFFHLLKQRNFGWDGLRSDDGQKELRAAYPVMSPKTISGKTVVGWKPKERRARRGVHFARGTLELAT